MNKEEKGRKRIGERERKREGNGMVKGKEKGIGKRMGQGMVEGKGDRAKERGNEWENGKVK